MLKLSTEVFDWNHLEAYDADIIVIGSREFGMYAPTNLTQEELFQAVVKVKEHQRLVGVRIDRIMQERDVEGLLAFLTIALTYPIHYYFFSDMSVLGFFATHPTSAQLVYNAKTLNCSPQDAAYYHKRGIDVVISHELPLDEVKNIANNGNIGIEGFAHSLIFYSNRKLISSYYDKYQIIPLHSYGTEYQIQEVNTKTWLYAVENQHGTTLYNDKTYAIYRELEELSAAKYFIIQPHFIDEAALIKTLAIYRRAIAYGPTPEGYQELSTLHSNLESGFLYRKPLILEEGQYEKN